MSASSVTIDERVDLDSIENDGNEIADSSSDPAEIGSKDYKEEEDPNATNDNSLMEENSESQRTYSAEVNEASFGLGWGGPPPDYDEQPDPGASKHLGTALEKSFAEGASPLTSGPDSDKSGFLGIFGGAEEVGQTTEVKAEASLTDTREIENEADFLTPFATEDHSNRALEVEEGFDYDHGPINQAEFLTGWGG